MKPLDERHWACHPDARGVTGAEKMLQERRAEVMLVTEASVGGQCYSYDDYCVVMLDDVYYLLNTTGCSCPSPTETWCVLSEGTLEEVKQEIKERIPASDTGTYYYQEEAACMKELLEQLP